MNMSLSSLARSSLLGRTTKRVTGVNVLGNAVPKRQFAKVYPEYPEFSVDKNNWIEKNEIVRENKYKVWRITQENVIPLFIMVVVFPLFVWSSSKQELTLRDEKQRNREASKDMI